MDTAIGRWYNGPHLQIPWTIGETIDNTRKFELAPATTPGIAGRFCGTPPDFLKGGLLHTPAHPAKYRPDGLPCCCFPTPMYPPIVFGWPTTTVIQCNAPFAGAARIPNCTPNHIKSVLVGLIREQADPDRAHAAFDWSMGTQPGLADIAAGHFDGPLKLIGPGQFVDDRLWTATFPTEVDVDQSDAYLTIRAPSGFPPYPIAWACSGLSIGTDSFRSFDGIHFLPFYQTTVRFLT